MTDKNKTHKIYVMYSISNVHRSCAVGINIAVASKEVTHLNQSVGIIIRHKIRFHPEHK